MQTLLGSQLQSWTTNKSVVWQTGLKHTIDMKQLGWDAGFLPVTLLII